MQKLRQFTLALSLLALGTLTACGGGELGNTNYPNDGDIVIEAATTGTPAGSYSINDDNVDSEADTFETSSGTVEYGAFENNLFYLQIGFLQSNTSKYYVVFDDSSDDYACRSAALSQEELDGWENFGPIPVCPSSLVIQADNHRVKASGFIINGLDDTDNQVKLGANVSWTLTAPGPVLN